MRVAWLVKRFYTNRDLIEDRFGRLYHLPVELHKLGHEQLVVAADYRGSESEEYSLDGVSFVSLPLRTRSLPRFVRASYARIAAFEPELLIASADIPFGVFGLLFSKRLGIPFAFDVYDDYTAFASAKLPGIKALFRRVLGRADLCIYASPPLERRLRALNSSTLIIENGIDPTLFKPMSKHDCRATLGIPESDTVIGFFGSIEPNRGGETLIEAARIVASARPNVRLLLAGTNGLGREIKEPWTDYRGPRPQSDIPVMINASDVVTVPYHATPLENMANACKIAEYLACGVPVVATRVSNFPDVFAKSPQAICEPGDPFGLSDAILRQLDTPFAPPAMPGEYVWGTLAGRLQVALTRFVK